MKNLQKYYEPLRNIKGIYILVFVTYILLARFVPIINFISQDVNTIIYSILAIIGSLILAADFFMTFSIFKSRENLILLAFWVICLISSLLNMEYGIINNIKTLVWMAIQFFLLFSFVNVKDESEINLTLKRTLNFSAAIWLVGVIVSIIQFLLQIGYVAPFVDYPRRQGFLQSRLFGIFSDPNPAAVTSVLIVLFCWMQLKNCNKKATRIYYYINIALQVIYVVLSGSRTAMYGGVMAAAVVGTLSARNRLIDKQSNKVAIKSILGGVVTVATCIAMIFVVKHTMPLLAEACSSCYETVGVSNPDEIKEPEISLEREDIREDNISNNRFEIWKDYIRISADRRLFGLSPRNLALYAEDHYPDSYVVTYEYETHNGWLAILICTGVAGAAVMLAFLVLYLREFILYIKAVKGEKCELEVILLLSALLLLAFSGLLYPELFFANTHGTLMFWLFLGYLLYYMKKRIAAKA